MAATFCSSCTAYSPGSNDNPWTIGTNDRIFEQTLSTLDAASNTLLVSIFQRNNGDTTTTGPPGAYPNARVSYTAFWQDGIGRQIASADYGTNNPGTLPLTPPPSRPARRVYSSTRSRIMQEAKRF